MKGVKVLGVALLTMVLLTVGCQKKNGCTDPNAINYDGQVTTDDGSCVYQGDNLQLKFHHMAGNNPLTYDTEFTLSTGRKIKFSKAQFYLSGFRADGSSVNKSYDTHLLITAEDDSAHAIGHLTGSNVTGLTLAIGVDSAYNHADPAIFDAEHALSANQPNFGHWGWNPGYKFIVIEGMMDSTAAMNGPVSYPFIYHLGFEEAYKPFEIMTDFSTNGSDHIIDLNVDWLAFFNDIDLPDENSSHMFTPPEAAIGHRIIDQGPNAITLKQ
jgi:hypothetical protein